MFCRPLLSALLVAPRAPCPLGPFLLALALPPRSRPPAGPELFRCRSVRGCGSAALRPAGEELLAFFLVPPIAVSPEGDADVAFTLWLSSSSRSHSGKREGPGGRGADVCRGPLQPTVESGHVKWQSAAYLSFSRRGRER